MHFGEPIDDQRLSALVRPGGGIDTVITADVYGEGAADRLLGRALSGLDRDSYSLIGAVGHDFYDGERDGPRGFPASPTRDCAGPASTRITCAWPPSAASSASASTDSTSCSSTTRIAPDFPRESVWDGMAALRDAGVTLAIGVAPGPANGFTLDLIDCFERFGDRIDWAMVILNPLEPWPGELCLAAAERHGIRVITRVVDYGGLFWDDVLPGHEFASGDHRRFRPDGWVEAGRERLDADAPDRRAPPA